MIRLFNFRNGKYTAYYWRRLRNIPPGITAKWGNRILWVEGLGRDWWPFDMTRKKFGPGVVYYRRKD